MPDDIPKQYEPKLAQERWYRVWEERGYFDANPNPDKRPHTIMIPLPNVTGALHMGHALNGTLQDLLTRWRRMQGFEALWMPGTDHAGIATQAVVERRMLEEEGLTRHDIGREALVERIWKWKDAYAGRILNQLKQLGASCDWRRTRFTLDEVCSRAVRRTFFKLFRDGLIYRGKRLVNWDAFLQTAVADDEVFHEEVDGHFWTFSYPVVETHPIGQMGPIGPISPINPATPHANETGERIAFSTTRPETMLGDTAVCVHPTDERYLHLIGKHVRIPLNGQVVPIIADALLAKKEMGTGAVKVTPAHDPNDYACGLRNDLPMINILNPNGTINENGGPYAGLDRYDARKRVVADMEKLGFLVGVEDRKIDLAKSDRSKEPIEPYLSSQWFVKMEDLAQAAIDAVNDRRVRFYPNRYAKTYLDWLSEKRDWCISRQLWWGHRIPVWSRIERPEERAEREKSESVPVFYSSDGVEACRRIVDTEVPGQKRILVCLPEESEKYLRAQLEADGFVQDEDVLDTWFSSALWPHATLGWPDTEHNPPTVERGGNWRLGGDVGIPLGRTLGARLNTLADWIVEGRVTARWSDTGDSIIDVDDSGSWSIAIDVAGESSNPSDESSDILVHVRNTKDLEVIDFLEAVNFVRDPSSLSPQPSAKNEVLSYFYPGNVLVTSRDIITLWVARMVLTGLYNMGDVPFAHVCVHPKILDGFGQTMSKSKGNGVDPMDLIDKYGTDAVRFTIASLAGETQDVRLPVGYECPHCETLIPQTLQHQQARYDGQTKPTVTCPKCKKSSQFTSPNYDPDPGQPVARMVSERFEYGRNFCNKLWNASRFAMLNLDGYSPGAVSEHDLKLEDRWILSRLSAVVHEVTELLSSYQFDAATRALRDFTWNEFCDWYLEMIKPRLRDEALRPVAQRTLVGVLDVLVRLLSPFVPFISEELWQRLNSLAPQRGLLEPSAAAESVVIAPWPEVSASWHDTDLEARFERLRETIVAVRNVRAVYGIPSGTQLRLQIRCEATVAAAMQDVAGQFDNLAKTMLEAAGASVERPAGSVSFSLGDADGFIPLEGVLDRKAELNRQRDKAAQLKGFIAGHERKLANTSFVERAPAHVVNEVRETLDGLQKQLASVEEIIAQLSDG